MSAQSTAVYSDLGKRTLIALPLLGLVTVITITGGLPFAFVSMAVGLICISEFSSMTKLPPSLRLAGALVVAVGVFCIWRDSQAWWLATLIVPAPFVLMIASSYGYKGYEMLVLSIKCLLGIYWIGLGLTHAILLRGLPHGAWLLTFVLAGTIASDTGAYLGGRAFGSIKLAPKLSRGKTVEGAFIGVVTALFVILALKLYQPWITIGQALVLGVGVAVAAPLGDLFESGVKRRSKVKDSGRLLGPHGGLLDRIDATLFAVIAGYWICQAYAL